MAIALASQWDVTHVIVEDTSSGMGLIQMLREQSRLSVIGRHPNDDRLPAVYALRTFVAAGGLLSYGMDQSEMFRLAPSYVDRILRGTSLLRAPGEAGAIQPASHVVALATDYGRPAIYQWREFVEAGVWQASSQIFSIPTGKSIRSLQLLHRF